MEKGSRLSNLLRTTDHKTIGLMYTTASFMFFILGGIMAMLMRAEERKSGAAAAGRVATNAAASKASATPGRLNSSSGARSHGASLSIVPLCFLCRPLLV